LSTNFTVPNEWDGQNVLLNFGAVDYEATVFVNGENVAFNRGGFFEFSVDVTRYINLDSSNEL
jgi:beta-galactosidase/beta-glucuronidase